jgi:hypothetical protein
LESKERLFSAISKHGETQKGSVESTWQVQVAQLKNDRAKLPKACCVPTPVELLLV